MQACRQQRMRAREGRCGCHKTCKNQVGKSAQTCADLASAALGLSRLVPTWHDLAPQAANLPRAASSRNVVRYTVFCVREAYTCISDIESCRWRAADCRSSCGLGCRTGAAVGWHKTSVAWVEYVARAHMCNDRLHLQFCGVMTSSSEDFVVNLRYK